MLLGKDLVDKFRSLHLEKFGVMINYNAAESQLKELAELVRLTSAKESEVEYAQAI